MLKKALKETLRKGFFLNQVLREQEHFELFRKVKVSYKIFVTTALSTIMELRVEKYTCPHITNVK